MERERIDDLGINGYQIIQKEQGFCFGMDAVLLSDFAQVKNGGRVLDLGTGTGILPILMEAKTKAVHLTGLEIQPEMAEMAARSVKLNHLEDKIEIVEGDIKEASAIFSHDSFDTITSNPPYMIGQHGLKNPSETKAIARAGKFDPVKAKENDIPMKYWNRLQKGETVTSEDGRVLTSDMILGSPRPGIKLTYCTDTRPVQTISEHAKNADLFICEGMYGEEGKEKKAREYKHMTFYEAAHLAKEADVKQMWLTHYSPSLIRAEEFMGKVKSIFPRAKAGKDGKTITLDFQEE